MERRLPKTEGMLVLDLRPWKSFDNVSTITDGPHEPLDNFEVSVIQSSFFFFCQTDPSLSYCDNEGHVCRVNIYLFLCFQRFELKSPRTRVHDKPGRLTRAVRRPETFLSKSFKEVRLQYCRHMNARLTAH